MKKRLLISFFIALLAVATFPLFYRLLAKEGSSGAVTPESIAVDEPASTPIDSFESRYERIATGMTYAQCVEIFGIEGTPRRAAGPTGADVAFYVWSSESGAEAPIMFMSGAVFGKQYHAPGRQGQSRQVTTGSSR